MARDKGRVDLEYLQMARKATTILPVCVAKLPHELLPCHEFGHEDHGGYAANENQRRLHCDTGNHPEHPGQRPAGYQEHGKPGQQK